MKPMKKIVILDGVALSIFSIFYGIQLIRFPEISNNYKIYELIKEIIVDGPTIGFIILLLGIMKLIGLIINNKYLKRIGLIGLMMAYAMLAISFLISTPPNTISILTGYAVYTVLSISLKEGNV